MKCPYCGSTDPFIVTQQVSPIGWIVFVCLLFFCFLLCWVPFVVGSLKEDVHRCSSCNSKVG